MAMRGPQLEAGEDVKSDDPAATGNMVKEKEGTVFFDYRTTIIAR